MTDRPRQFALPAHVPMDAPTQLQERIESIISDALDTLAGAYCQEDIEVVVRLARADTPIDLNVHWRAFSAAYLLTNYRKALATLRLLPERDYAHVIDVGAGTGAAALAALTLSAERNTELRSLCVLDRSGPAIDFAGTTLVMAASELGMAFDYVSVKTDILDYHRPDSVDLAICAHVLCEHDDRTVNSIWSQVTRYLRPHGIAVIVERHDDLLPERLQTDACTESSFGELSVRSPSPTSKHEIKPWRTGWLFHRQAPKWQAELLRCYFLCWNTQDVGLLDEVFTPTAVYHEKPFDPVISGIDDIRGYWRDRVVPQPRPIASAIRVNYGLLSATVAWEAFIDEAPVKHVSGLMLITFDPEQRRISALHEIFRTRTIYD